MSAPTKEAWDDGFLPCQNGGMGKGKTHYKIGGRPCIEGEHFCGGGLSMVVNIRVIRENTNKI